MFGDWKNTESRSLEFNGSLASSQFNGRLMARQLLLLVSVGLVLMAAEARVRLNSIRTLVLGEGLALNRSLWEPSLELTLYQCMSDLECVEGSYCHRSTKAAHSRCQACRRRKRRCRRDSMCCPGNLCSGGACVPDSVVFARQRTLLTDAGMSPESEAKPWRKRMSVKAQAGDSCLRSADCSAGFCCARHFWTRICKPVLREGQVCSQRRRRQGLELFQRCPCGTGLSCQTLRDPGTKASSSSSPSSSSSLLAAAAKSRFAASSSSRRSAAPPSAWSAAKTRLHVCQKN